MKVCLIPARSGSKRIKNKNIKLFFGKPLIYYSINAAKKSKVFDKIYVSTDKKNIGNIAKKYGAEVPFIRPKKISKDSTIDAEVINHFTKYCKKNNINIKYFCYIYPTAPLLSKKIIKNTFKILKKNKCYRVFTICKFPSKIERALKKNKKNQIAFKNKKFARTRSQNLKDYYYDAGQLYWYNFKSKNRKTIGYQLKDLEAVDINNMNDFNLAKKIYISKIN